MKRLSVVLMLFTFVGGIIASEQRFNQQSDVKSIHTQIKRLTITLHTHAHDDYSVRIAHLEAEENPTPSQRRMLSYYQSQKERVAILLAGLED